MHTYILDWDGKTPIKAELLEGSKWRSDNVKKCVVKKTHFKQVEISTVFLGLNHRFGEGPPILWESMIFGGMFNNEQVRYTSHDAAVEGHKELVAKVKATCAECEGRGKIQLFTHTVECESCREINK